RAVRWATTSAMSWATGPRAAWRPPSPIAWIRAARPPRPHPGTRTWCGGRRPRTVSPTSRRGARTGSFGADRGRLLPRVRLVAGVLSLAACATGSGRDVPAVITTPTAESRAELRRVVSRALNRATLTLADDALTRDSTLIIERARPRGADGAPLSGRERG